MLVKEKMKAFWKNWVKRFDYQFEKVGENMATALDSHQDGS